MKKLTTGLAIAVFIGVLVYATSAAVATPRNEGVPLPDWSEYQWEIEHKVKPGEYLYMLAGYYYKDGKKWNWIYELNRNKIMNPNKIRQGQVLIIKVPRGWEPPMPYNSWYERMRDQYSAGTGTQYYGVAPASAPVRASSREREKLDVGITTRRVKKKVGVK